MTTLADVQNHLEQGYFLEEDMELLGLKGFVTVAQVRGELFTLLAPKESTAPDLSAEQRASASQAASAAEEKAATDRAALVQSIADKAAADKLLVDFKNSVLASGGKLD